MRYNCAWILKFLILIRKMKISDRCWTQPGRYHSNIIGSQAWEILTKHLLLNARFGFFSAGRVVGVLFGLLVIVGIVGITVYCCKKRFNRYRWNRAIFRTPSKDPHQIPPGNRFFLLIFFEHVFVKCLSCLKKIVDLNRYRSYLAFVWMGVIFKSFEWDLYRVKFFIYNVKDDGVENESKTILKAFTFIW